MLQYFVMFKPYTYCTERLLLVAVGNRSRSSQLLADGMLVGSLRLSNSRIFWFANLCENCTKHMNCASTRCSCSWTAQLSRFSHRYVFVTVYIVGSDRSDRTRFAQVISYFVRSTNTSKGLKCFCDVERILIYTIGSTASLSIFAPLSRRVQAENVLDEYCKQHDHWYPSYR